MRKGDGDLEQPLSIQTQTLMLFSADEVTFVTSQCVCIHLIPASPLECKINFKSNSVDNKGIR